MAIRLTRRQADTLAVIAAHTKHIGYPPTVREISAALGIASWNWTQRILERLESQGVIRHQRGRQRTITIVEKIETVS